LIDLGVVIKIPEGFHALLMPRSSTFKTWRILQSNGIGLIDEDFMGIEDVWKFPAYYVGDQEYRIPAGTRIAQFFLQKRYDFIKCAYEPDVVSRGGHGSSGL
jgi:dUTP pyrophosphatase